VKEQVLSRKSTKLKRKAGEWKSGQREQPMSNRTKENEELKREEKMGGRGESRSSSLRQFHWKNLGKRRKIQTVF